MLGRYWLRAAVDVPSVSSDIAGVSTDAATRQCDLKSRIHLYKYGCLVHAYV